MNDMSHLLAIPESPIKPTLDPAIYVEPKKRGGDSETARQGHWVTFMRKYARACLVFSIPNGTHIRSHAGRAKVKREGLHSGFPDNGVLWSTGRAFPEWKDGTSDPSDNQIETLNWMHANGYHVAIVRTPWGCIDWLRSIGAPIPEIRP